MFILLVIQLIDGHVLQDGCVQNTLANYFTAGRLPSIVCMSVCSHLKIDHTWHVHTSRKLSVICGRGSFLLLRHCNTLCTFGFVNDVMFSRNGASAGKHSLWSKTTRCFVQFARWQHRGKVAVYSGGRDAESSDPQVGVKAISLTLNYPREEHIFLHETNQTFRILTKYCARWEGAAPYPTSRPSPCFLTLFDVRRHWLSPIVG